MDGNVRAIVDGGGEVYLDNPGNDREAGQTDTYMIGLASTEVVVRSHTSDGWCIENVTYNGIQVQLCHLGAWLDSNCEADSEGYTDPDRPCRLELRFDPSSGVSSLCLPPPSPPPPSPPPAPPGRMSCDLTADADSNLNTGKGWAFFANHPSGEQTKLLYITISEGTPPALNRHDFGSGSAPMP